MALKLRTVAVNLPFGLGGVQIDVNSQERRAAWQLYVELATRVAAQPLAAGEGSAREALNSLYQIFGLTREILREAGPEVAHGPDSFGPIAIRILNEGLRPFVSRWHQRLNVHERETGALSSDADWAARPEFDRELRAVQDDIDEYIRNLAKIAGATT